MKTGSPALMQDYAWVCLEDRKRWPTKLVYVKLALAYLRYFCWLTVVFHLKMSHFHAHQNIFDPTLVHRQHQLQSKDLMDISMTINVSKLQLNLHNSKSFSGPLMFEENRLYYNIKWEHPSPNWFHLKF